MRDALVHGSDLSGAEIRDQVKCLIGAGYDTTASSLAWLLWETSTEQVTRPTGAHEEAIGPVIECRKDRVERSRPGRRRPAGAGAYA